MEALFLLFSSDDVVFWKFLSTEDNQGRPASDIDCFTNLPDTGSNDIHSFFAIPSFASQLLSFPTSHTTPTKNLIQIDSQAVNLSPSLAFHLHQTSLTPLSQIHYRNLPTDILPQQTKPLHPIHPKQRKPNTKITPLLFQKT